MRQRIGTVTWYIFRAFMEGTYASRNGTPFNKGRLTDMSLITGTCKWFQ